MKGGSSTLVVLLVDGDGGQAATYGPFLIDDNLHSGSEVLLQEMGHSRAPDPSSNNSCQQVRPNKAGKERRHERERLVTFTLPSAERRLLALAFGGLMKFQRG